jgi:hypothetical protein
MVENALYLRKLNEKQIDWHMPWAGVMHVRRCMEISHKIREKGRSRDFEMAGLTSL